ncbi:MAG: DUF5119 domain-containing protein [Roseburia sp.]|nr:DUF5119 domain-containing protein [Roseburia sp.]
MKNLSIILSLFTAFVLSGCRQELCYDHEGLTDIAFGWEKEWERDYGCNHAASWDAEFHGLGYDDLRPDVASSVTMIAYPAAGESYNLFLSAEGAKVPALATGSLLFYNDDTECVVIDETASIPNAIATTTGRSRSSLQPLHKGERTVNAPDVLYAALIESHTGTESHTTDQLTVSMRPVVYTYLIRYNIEQGGELVSLARGALAGMAEKVMLRDGSTPADAATILFDASVSTDGKTVNALVSSFGVPSHPGYADTSNTLSSEGPFTLNLELLLRDGSMQTFEFDVTRQMANQPRGGVISVSGIYVINNSTQVDSGFDVEVDDWGDYEDVILPPFET